MLFISNILLLFVFFFRLKSSDPAQNFGNRFIGIFRNKS